MKNTVHEVAYIGSESHYMQRSGEWNPSRPLSPGVFPAFAASPAGDKLIQANRINPNFASLPTFRFDGNGDYNALQVILRRRSVNGLQYQVFYTYSHSIDTKSTIAGGESRQESNTVLDLLEPGRDRGVPPSTPDTILFPRSLIPFPSASRTKPWG